VARLDGRVAIVTGANQTDAGRNIGGETASVLADAGASVVVADLPGSGNARLAEVLNETGRRALAVDVDLRQETQVEAMVEAAVAEFGRIDVLHNNAGLIPAADLDVLATDTAIWDAVMEVDLRGAMLATKCVLPHMLELGGGSIINTSSSSSRAGDAIHTAYGCAKAALEALARSVASQYGRRGIRCNVVCPGLTMSPAAKRDIPQPFVDSMLRLTPSTRLAESHDQALIVLFLASEDSFAVNGQTIVSDGGMLAQLPWVPDLIDQGLGGFGNDK
jgi:NAD(P)-dependent dehydrogenase (short-subunit alcohol dehydrogenase family)